MRSRLRFIIAISLAVVLGGWLAWTSIGGSLETYAGPSEIATGTETTYRLNGRVASGRPPMRPPRPRARRACASRWSTRRTRAGG